ncbi:MULTISPECIES: LysR family transcriptional regulator [unclassified Herbaspirillum]|uniref:LysR family transcriptional regulator n=1 Tax=unclassified Herbaspirillum TaxID=2624150 RepID=UPI001175BC83|nr:MULTISPECIES: LysR family transcriptional regulator [unclassified Herbaspirillum]MBB5390321.1 DNA-binding transcriptional LysR family regulator [Herbaspirillum sp. SJZ102]TQK09182.1 DNA-binding transcriptional LysR family regulator [Herbaspirillum sp. SJZ130]TQK14131.1 DNA-binding transcriptional LysR family regulator [Herbaspirillum sp. SJZ106]
MLPDLHELDAFAAVARHRSFRKAAAERGVSASALSHALRGLEQRLGVRLLHRTTRSVTPTEAGQRLLARLDPALREVAEALADATALQAEPAGTVRLNVPRPAARLLLASALAGFAAAYPRVQLEIVTDDGLADIVGDGFDAGIRFGESLAGDMVAVPIGPPQRFVCVAAPDYLAARGVPQAPRELHGHACIGRRFPSGNRYAWEFQSEGQALSIEVAGPLLLDDDALMIQAARDGAGIAYVYEAMVREDLAAGRLQAVLEDWGAPAGRFFLYYPGRRHLPMALRALADFIRK